MGGGVCFVWFWSFEVYGVASWKVNGTEQEFKKGSTRIENGWRVRSLKHGSAVWIPWMRLS